MSEKDDYDEMFEDLLSKIERPPDSDPLKLFIDHTPPKSGVTEPLNFDGIVEPLTPGADSDLYDPQPTFTQWLREKYGAEYSSTNIPPVLATLFRDYPNLNLYDNPETLIDPSVSDEPSYPTYVGDDFLLYVCIMRDALQKQMVANIKRRCEGLGWDTDRQELICKEAVSFFWENLPSFTNIAVNTLWHFAFDGGVRLVFGNEALNGDGIRKAIDADAELFAGRLKDNVKLLLAQSQVPKGRKPKIPVSRRAEEIERAGEAWMKHNQWRCTPTKEGLARELNVTPRTLGRWVGDKWEQWVAYFEILRKDGLEKRGRRNGN